MIIDLVCMTAMMLVLGFCLWLLVIDAGRDRRALPDVENLDEAWVSKVAGDICDLVDPAFLSVEDVEDVLRRHLFQADEVREK